MTGLVIITSFIVPLCFLLEILEYFFPEFLFQAVAVKSEQAFQAIPGTEQRGTKIHLISLAYRNRCGGAGWKEGNSIQELKGNDNFLCGNFSGIFVRQEPVWTSKMSLRMSSPTEGRIWGVLAQNWLIMVNKLQDFVEFRTDYKSGNAAQSAIHLQSTIIH